LAPWFSSATWRT